MKRLRYFLVANLTACLLAGVSSALADSPAQTRVAAVIDQYTSDDTLGVAVVELDGRWIAGVQELAGKIGGEDSAELVNHPGFALSRGMIESFRAAGARELVVVFSINVFSPDTMPVLAITVEKPEQAKAVAELARSLQQMSGGTLPLQIASIDGHVLVGHNNSVNRLRDLKPTEGTRLAMAGELLSWPERQGEPMAALLFAPGDSFRRVVRALWPELPAPFESLTGALIADDLEQLVVLVRCPPEWQLKIGLKSNSDRAAETWGKLVENGWTEAMKTLVDQKADPAVVRIVEAAAEVLTPTREGTTLTIHVDSGADKVEKLVSSIVIPAIESAREGARRNMRLNNLKQLALAMQNFHDTQKQLPASAAIVDKEGKPLLSWRVAILPFLEQQALFNEFHLDEPWDSPHNLKLARTIPAPFVNPSYPKLASEGKTNYLLPVHPGSIFPPATGKPVEKPSQFLGREFYLATGTAYKSITDGTVNTLMIVEAPRELAVPWTKPSDWEVDLATAFELLRRGESKQVAVVFCDGSAQILVLDDEMEKNLPKLLTPDGGEIIGLD
ncbi:DUF1559 family PulG-like putative transporter [Aeoliella sp. SH292]|uniref:DUF1559 family PulG-like putative transporter n=1 Tax=Aeoliella sp. SH292 TaxID=3454464 RepID=UPI003F972350